MPLQDLSLRPKIIPGAAACTPEALARALDAIRLNIQVIVNNLTEVQENTGAPTLVDIGDEEPVTRNDVRWAISLYDGTEDTWIEPTADNLWRGQVLAFPCDDSQGSDPHINAPLWIILPGRDGAVNKLPQGSIFAWAISENEEPVIVTDYSGVMIRWGIAQSDSVDGEVVVRECDNAIGDNPVAPDITVILPMRAGYSDDVSADDVIAFMEAKDGTYVCVSDYTLYEKIIRFQLAGAIAPNGNASGEILGWDAGALALTGTFVTVYDLNDPGRWRGPIGYRGIAIRKKDSGRYEIIWMEEIAELAVVTLTTDMTAGVSANATVNANWNGNDPGAAIDVYDTTTSMYSDLVSGQVVMVKYDWKNGRYRPIDVRENLADYGLSAIEFTATGDMTASAMTVTVDNSWGPLAPVASPATVEDIADLFLRAFGPNVGAGRLGAKGLAIRDTVRDKWIVVECESLAGWAYGVMLGDMAGTPKKGSFQRNGYGGSQQDVQPPGTTFDVYGIAGLTDDLLTDDYTMALYNATDGRYYAITPRQSTGLQYCRCQHCWEYNGGDPRVSVKLLTGWNGTETGAAFYVYLRGTAYDRDPVAYKGQDITFTQDADGEYITNDPNAWSAKIGTVVFSELNYAPTLEGGFAINGWARQDGVYNAVALGGSGKDWSTNDGSPIASAEAPPIYMAGMSASTGAPGNSLLPTDESLAHSHDGNSSPVQTGISATSPAHPDHVHKVGLHCGTQNFASNPADLTGYLITSLSDPHGTPDEFHTGKQLTYESGSHDATDHAALTMDHEITISDPGHYHPTTILPTFQPVPYKHLLPIERVDNSFEVNGI